MIAVGIDPGLTGAVVALGTDGELLGYWDTPTIQLAKGKAKRDYDVRGMRDILFSKIPGGATAFIEVQQAFPGQGLSSTFKTGKGAGLWEMGLACVLPGYETVRPHEWQRSMLRGVPGDGKARSLLRAGQLFPDLPLTKPNGRKLTMDGRSDAALIAAWGLRRMRGEG